MKKFIEITAPPARWKLAAIVLSGVLLGFAILTIYFSKAWSYLSEDPKTCVNCHIMAPQYASWAHSAHREVATCNDCHVPHDNIFNKYYFKAMDGLRHATIFTLRNEPQVIRIRAAGREAVQQNCIRCHLELIKDEKLLTQTEYFHHFRTDRSCVHCHRETPHGRVNSLSSAPYTRVPIEQSPIPEWIQKATK